MSPRSEEFMAMARERLAAAHAALHAGSPTSAVSLAYSAMLYAARAALSEEDRYAKTHTGTWDLFRRSFVEPARFDGELFESAHKTQPIREDADYDARVVPPEQAEAIVALAERFVAAVAEVFP